MRRTTLAILALLACLTANAQRAIFLFDDFKEAEMSFSRGGRPVRALINFDANGQKLYYMEGSQMMELTNGQAIDTIRVEDRVFVWKESKICEQCKMDGNEILINWHFTESFVGKEGALGITTQGKAESYYVPGLNSESSFENASRYENRTDVWKQKCDNTYFFTCKGKECKVRRVQELYKIYPEHRDALKTYVRKNNLLMENADEAMRIISYLYSL